MSSYFPQELDSDDDEPTPQMQPVVDLDPSLVEEQATAEIDTAQAEAATDRQTEAHQVEAATDQEAVAEDQTAEAWTQPLTRSQLKIKPPTRNRRSTKQLRLS
jgi:hypothetical protein